MRLHLGCGQRYFDGYVNIDFPMSEHTVQVKTVADLHADLTALRYSSGSIDEVRLHHVFEHFTRPTAAALLAGWCSWLRVGGVVRIEVPDFNRTARSMLNPLSSRQRKMVGMRHLFGSHEAGWAVHCEGWSVRSLSDLLVTAGLKVLTVKKNSWKGTYNLEVSAEKVETLSAHDIANRVEKHFRLFILDESPSELELLNVWMKEFKKQLERCWST